MQAKFDKICETNFKASSNASLIAYHILKIKVNKDLEKDDVLMRSHLP
jgi:hypothetical protein